jgi:hypothetical protein
MLALIEHDGPDKIVLITNAGRCLSHQSDTNASDADSTEVPSSTWPRLSRGERRAIARQEREQRRQARGATKNNEGCPTVPQDADNSRKREGILDGLFEFLFPRLSAGMEACPSDVTHEGGRGNIGDEGFLIDTDVCTETLATGNKFAEEIHKDAALRAKIAASVSKAKASLAKVAKKIVKKKRERRKHRNKELIVPCKINGNTPPREQGSAAAARFLETSDNGGLLGLMLPERSADALQGFKATGILQPFDWCTRYSSSELFHRIVSGQEMKPRRCGPLAVASNSGAMRSKSVDGQNTNNPKKSQRVGSSAGGTAGLS